jgi:hypothetical protein
MTTVGDVEARVAATYEDLGLPAWPDPHAGMGSPDDEEYSRLTDPGRYRIVHARARAWADALEDLLGARVETLGPPPSAPSSRAAFDRGIRLVPPTPDGLPLLLLERDVFTMPDQDTLAALDIAVARAVVVVAREPDCGCDACDSGSRDLLDAIDSTIRHVIGGPFVVLRGEGWQAQWHPGGWRSGSDGRGHDWDALVEACRCLAAGDAVPLPEDAEAFVGRAWVG